MYSRCSYIKQGNEFSSDEILISNLVIVSINVSSLAQECQSFYDIDLAAQYFVSQYTVKELI